jgi:hypothetical protein
MYTSHRLSFRRCAVWLVSYSGVREPRKATILVFAIGAVNAAARELREQDAQGRVGVRERDERAEGLAIRRRPCFSS